MGHKTNKIMKRNIIIVSYVSFTSSDNYLHTEQKSFTNRLKAQDYYEDSCKYAYEECKWGSQVDEPEDERDEDCTFDVDEERNGSFKDGKAGYKVESQAYEGYWVSITYEVQEVDVYSPQIFLFDRNVFTEQEANEVSWEDAHELAQVEKGLRHVWQYDAACGTFAGDFNRGCMDSQQYYIRIYNGE